MGDRKIMATSSTITKTATAVALATAVGTGIYVTTHREKEFVDDVKAVTVEIPQVNIPKVEIPKVNIPKVEIPTVQIPQVKKIITLTDEQVSKLNLPKVASVTVGSHSITIDNAIIIPTAGGSDCKVLPATVDTVAIVTATVNGDYQVKTENVNTTIIVVPRPDGTYKVEIPQVLKQTIGAYNTQTIEVPNVKIEKVQAVTIVLDYDKRIPEIMAIMKLQQQLFKDKRNLAYDTAFGIDSKTWPQWRKIYQENKPFTLQPVPLKSGIRMISEAHVPENTEEWTILNENLEFYQKQGYNSVLFCFNGTENSYDCNMVVDLIKSKDMNVYFAYSGPEDLRWSLFQNTEKIEDIMRTIAGKCDGVLIGWRRTALHLFIPDDQFVNFIMSTARKYNEKIAVIGEAYYGANAESNGKMAVAYNIPNNCSGVAVTGVGFSGVDLNGALNNLFTEAKNCPKLGVVIGSKPYFLTHNKTGRTFDENLKVKQSIEKRFVKNGCVGTITIHGDSSAIRQGKTYITTDMLQKFKIGK